MDQLSRGTPNIMWQCEYHVAVRISVATNIRIIRIFEYFLPNINIRIRIRWIFKSRILFEYSNILLRIFEMFT